MKSTRIGKIALLLCIGLAFTMDAAGVRAQSDTSVLARIGDKVLTVREFKQRTELTVRPDNFKDKNTALNNLVSEKILSIEAQMKSTLPANPVFQATLKGIKEQAMRDQLQDIVEIQTVKVDTTEIKAAYRTSQREYDVEFYTFRDQVLAAQIADTLENAPELWGKVFDELAALAGKKPVRKVKFKDSDDDAIHDALFKTPLDTGTVIGPLRVGTGEFIVMRITNWTDYPIVSGDDQLERWGEVKEFLKESKGRKNWGFYQAEVMLGKKVEFNRPTFDSLAGISCTYYIMRRENDSLRTGQKILPPLGQHLDLAALFFTIDDEKWSVGRFQKELLSHPLVFRTTDLDSSNFRNQFKLAVIDMIRDYYLTAESYKRSLDATEEVHRTVDMWKDALLAQDEEKRIIESAVKEGKVKATDTEGVRKYWLSYLQDLQQKYSGRIFIDQKALAKIKLTNIDMFAFRQGVPYPVAVPDFPIFISSPKLDSLLRKLQTL